MLNKKSSEKQKRTQTPGGSAATSRRRVNRAREQWAEYFSDALNALMSTDEDRVKEISEQEAQVLVRSARRVADAALVEVEERWGDEI